MRWTAQPAFAIAGQALVSGENFLLALMVARSCPADEYGLYVLALGAILFFNELAGGAAINPMTVLAPALEGSRQREFLRGVFSLFMALVAACCAVLAVVWSFFGPPGPLAALIAALACIQGREFLRRTLFAVRGAGSVLANDLAHTPLLLALVFMLQMDQSLSPASVLFCMAATGALGFIVGLVQTRKFLKGGTVDLAGTMRRVWRIGRWTLPGRLGAFACAQANIFILAALLGQAATGEFHAARNAAVPLMLLTMAVRSLMAPRLAGIFANKGPGPLTGAVSRWITLLGVAALGYSLAVLLFAEQIMALLYGMKYAAQADLARLWCLPFAFAALRLMPALGLGAMLRQDVLLYLGLGSGLICLALSGIFIPFWGKSGALAAQGIGELFFLVGATLMFLRLIIRGGPLGSRADSMERGKAGA